MAMQVFVVPFVRNLLINRDSAASVKIFSSYLLYPRLEFEFTSSIPLMSLRQIAEMLFLLGFRLTPFFILVVFEGLAILLLNAGQRLGNSTSAPTNFSILAVSITLTRGTICSVWDGMASSKADND